jgi:hypothetical protein
MVVTAVSLVDMDAPGLLRQAQESSVKNPAAL